MTRAREVMARMPELARFHERLQDESWPTAAEVAEARWALMQGRVERQAVLKLEAQ